VRRAITSRSARRFGLLNKLVPLADPLFPIYREKVAKKDAEVAGK